MWSTHDLACAHCRTRKIRCGRERPQCESCKRDGVECRYSSPGKRINHVKLLCQNFEALEDQLNTIQGDISALTTLMKSNPIENSTPTDREEVDYSDLSEKHELVDICKDRHIVRDETYSTDRYHGPCSLFALCKEFKSKFTLEGSSSDALTDNDHLIQCLLENLCTDASKEEHIGITSHYPRICLPPSQVLSAAAGRFFKHADYATDIFVQSNFRMQMDRVYAQPLSPSHEAWVVCFNIVVLLRTRGNQNSPNTASSAQSLNQILQMTVNNPRMFLTPTLVNVQALALLSHAAEQYASSEVTELIFAQACLLAKTMGLHQSRASSEGRTPEEVIEKSKVFRSLYIRDKNYAICRGSASWLPTYDSGIPLSSHQLSGDETMSASRTELARIQDEVYRHLHSSEAPTLPKSKHSHSVSRIEQRLEQWANKHQIMKYPTDSLDSADLALSFLATRLCLFRGSSDQSITQQGLNDAKISCIILIQTMASCPDTNLMKTLDQLLDWSRSSSPSAGQNDCYSSHRPQRKDGNGPKAALKCLTASSPLAAPFILASHIMRACATDDELDFQIEEELSLLERLRDCYAAEKDHDKVQSFALKTKRTLDTLVRVIRQKLYPDADATPSMTFNDVSSFPSQSSSCRNSPPGRPNSPIDGVPSLPGDIDAASTAFLLPFTQPTSTPDLQFSGSLQWSGYGQQMDCFGRVGKRPRLPSQPDLFDVTTAFAENDPFTMFDFLGDGNEFPLFDIGQ